MKNPTPPISSIAYRYFFKGLIVAFMPLFPSLGCTDAGTENNNAKMQSPPFAKPAMELAQIDTARTAQSYQMDMEKRIHDNEIRLSDMKAKMQQDQGERKDIYQKKMIELEARNARMKARIKTYSQTTKDSIASYRKGFNTEMAEFDRSLSDMGTRREGK